MDFGTVLIVVVIIAVIVAAASWGSGRIYSGLGRTGGLTMEHEASPAGGGAGAGQATTAQAREEIRQMLAAKSARGRPAARRRSTWTPSSKRSTRPAVGHDAALREEVRQLVIARNERRLRRGRGLDLEQEVERQLRDLGVTRRLSRYRLRSTWPTNGASSSTTC